MCMYTNIVKVPRASAVKDQMNEKLNEISASK